MTVDAQLEIYSEGVNGAENENTEAGSQSWAKKEIINISHTVLPQSHSLLLILDSIVTSSSP